MDEYEVKVPLEGFNLIVKVEAPNPRDARSNALSIVMYQFPLVINRSEEFKLDGFTVGRIQSIKKVE